MKPSDHPYEAEIGTFLSSGPLAADPHNHCVPILEVLQVPDDEDKVVLVMPLLRSWDNPPLETIGTAVDLFSQIFEVCPGNILMIFNLALRAHVAYRDCSSCISTMSRTGRHQGHYFFP